MELAAKRTDLELHRHQTSPSCGDELPTWTDHRQSQVPTYGRDEKEKRKKKLLLALFMAVSTVLTLIYVVGGSESRNRRRVDELEETPFDAGASSDMQEVYTLADTKFTETSMSYHRKLQGTVPIPSALNATNTPSGSFATGAATNHTESTENQSTTLPENLIVGAYYYPWYGPNFHGSRFLRDDLIPKQAPTLGKYNDSDPAVIGQHLKWSRQANIGLWATSWWGAGFFEDKTTLEVILPHKDLGSHKIAVMYETTGRIVISAPTANVAADMKHLCENYFPHPNYYTIDDRPVLFMYVTRKLSLFGVLEKVVGLMRSTAATYGYNPYIIGDQVWQAAPSGAYSPFAQLDAVTNYDAIGNIQLPNGTHFVTQSRVDNYFVHQRDWKAAANSQGCAYVPVAVPGFNDRGIRMAAGNAVASRQLTSEDDQGSLFRAMLRGAVNVTDYRTNRLLMINSFNEWHEESQIEPATGGNATSSPYNLTLGVMYEAYGELYLDILNNETSSASTNVTVDFSSAPFIDGKAFLSSNNGTVEFETPNSSAPVTSAPIESIASLAPSLIQAPKGTQNITFPSPISSDFTVGAYYYPWYGSNFHGSRFLRDELLPQQRPVLGKYNDSDPAVIGQHLKWSRQANIGLWATSWWGPGAFEDKTTLEVILPHKDLGSHKIALLYETFGRVGPTSPTENVEADIIHMCEKYFSHPNYHRIDDRPVLFIYVSRQLSLWGVLEEVVGLMRSTAAIHGYNPYIIGDQVWQAVPSGLYVPFIQLDAVTNYDVIGNMQLPNGTHYVTQDRVDQYFAQQRDWKAAANSQSCAYVPPAVPGFNDRGVRMAADNAVASRQLTADDEEGSLFRAMLRGALTVTDNRTNHLLMINSFNEWHEDSQIEPATGGNDTTFPYNMTLGVVYEAYEELYLDILKNETSSASPNVPLDFKTLTILRDETSLSSLGRAIEITIALSHQATNAPTPSIASIATSTVQAATNSLSGSQHISSKAIIGAYYYPWYGSNFHGKHFLRDDLTPKQLPELGYYNDTDPQVIAQHLKWSRKANIGLWVTSWWGPGGREDKATLNVILPHEDLGSHKIALMYETIGRIGPNSPTENIEKDMKHICEKYFSHPNYYTIEGRPVLFIYVSRLIDQWGVLGQVLHVMRGIAGYYGINPYIVGDQVWQDAPTGVYLPFTKLDAVTNYDAIGSIGLPSGTHYVTQSRVDQYFVQQRNWRAAANSQGCAYVPVAVPGFNDRGIRMAAGNAVASRKLTANGKQGSLFRAMVRGALNATDYRTNHLLMINSFNEWHEDSQIEPTISGGGKTASPYEFTLGVEYEAYGELYLDILRNETVPASLNRSKHITIAATLAPTQSIATPVPTRATATPSGSQFPVLRPLPAALTVGAYYYPWYGADFHKGASFLREDLIPVQLPILGKYNDTDPVVIAQHLQWSQQANIGLWATSWWGPGSREDRTTLSVILPHQELGTQKIALVYETKGRIAAASPTANVAADMKYIAKTTSHIPTIIPLRAVLFCSCLSPVISPFRVFWKWFWLK